MLSPYTYRWVFDADGCSSYMPPTMSSEPNNTPDGKCHEPAKCKDTKSILAVEPVYEGRMSLRSMIDERCCHLHLSEAPDRDRTPPPPPRRCLLRHVNYCEMRPARMPVKGMRVRINTVCAYRCVDMNTQDQCLSFP